MSDVKQQYIPRPITAETLEKVLPAEQARIASMPQECPQSLEGVSTAFSAFTIAKCLGEANAFIGQSDRDLSNWEGINLAQVEFVESFLQQHLNEMQDIPEMKCVVDTDVSKVNAFLKEEGFSIQLQENHPLAQFAVASVLKVLLEWQRKATREYDSELSKKYDTIKLHKETTQFFEHPQHHEPIVRVLAKSGDSLFMTKYSRPIRQFDLVSLANSFMTHQSQNWDFKGCIAPMIKFDEEADISWLTGFHETMDPMMYYIAQALQQNKFRMNEKGAKFESATAMLVGCSGMLISTEPPRPPYLMDEPFLVWVMRPGLSQPLFAAQLYRDSWKDPGQL